MRRVFSLVVFGTLLVGCETETGSEPISELQVESGNTEPSDGQAGGFALSADNTQVLFTGTKKSGDSRAGGFKLLTGNIALSEDGISGINVLIDTESLFSEADRLTGHLKSEDFFSVSEFPELKFESTRIEGEGEGELTVTGDLTMHGETNQISFAATVSVADGNVSLKSEFQVDRTRFGMNYTGQPDDPINADVDIKIIVGANVGNTGESTPHDT